MGMSTKTQSELSKFFGPVVATGAERIPSFISDFETKDEVIIEQELIADHPEQNLFAFRVEEFVADASDNQLTKLE